MCVCVRLSCVIPGSPSWPPCTCIPSSNEVSRWSNSSVAGRCWIACHNIFCSSKVAAEKVCWQSVENNIQYIIRIIFMYYTSSTAQGGGGSFKNRKPIGEVGCCESRMAERSRWWIERWLMSPLFLSFFSLFLWLSTYLPTYLLSLSLSLSACLSVYLFIDLSTYLSI